MAEKTAKTPLASIKQESGYLKERIISGWLPPFREHYLKITNWNMNKLTLLKKNNKFPLFIAALVGGIVTSFATVVKAQDIFENNGIQFDVDTIVEFEFVESNGAYQSTFGVINLDTGEKTPLLAEVKPSDSAQNVGRPSDYQNDTGTGTRKDFRGTPGNTVPQPLTEFQFKAKTRYVFYLESTYNGKPAGIVYSTNASNPGGNQQAQLEGGFQSLANNGTTIRWDDTGSVLVRQDKEDRDFDDFIVRAGGSLDCPYGKTANNR